MNKPIPEFTSDEDAERFVETADLSQHDLTHFRPARFEFQRLRRAWAKGVESGDAGPVDFSDLKSEARCLAERIETGLCQADRDEFATEQDVAAAFIRWR